MSERLDQQMLEDLRDIMEDEFSILMETFLTESQKQFAAIKSALGDADMDLARRSAHSLKGSCGNIGALGLQAQCAELEYAARDEQSEQAAQLLQAVGAELDEVCAEVRTHC